MWDVPGPGEEQEGPSSRERALRADLRKETVGGQQRTGEGPKAGMNTQKVHMIDIGSLRVCFRVVVVFICAYYVALPSVQLAHGLEGEKVQ